MFICVAFQAESTPTDAAGKLALFEVYDADVRAQVIFALRRLTTDAVLPQFDTQLIDDQIRRESLST